MAQVENLKAESVGTLLKELAESSRDLVKDELRLARAEIGEKADQLKQGAILIGIAAVPALMALILVPFIMLYGLSEIMPPWAAALVTFAVFAVIAAVLGGIAYKKLKDFDPKLGKTVDTVQESTQWLKNRLS